MFEENGKENSKENHIENSKEIIDQLTGINNQLAIRNRRSRRIWTTIGIILIVVLFWNILLMVVGTAAYGTLEIQQETVIREESVEVIVDEP